jgi:maltooligosyltrehalose trehalohydrolase
MRYAHRMPFGATIEHGATRFRLWAPGAREVAVMLGPRGDATRMLAPLDGGWFEASVADAGAGTRYAFRIDGARTVPDPASRCNPEGVHAASAVVDPRAYDWRQVRWRGRAWDEAVLYELHVGTFTPGATFAAAIERLDTLAGLGVTAIELMPVAAFPGRRNWGYDGVLPFAPAPTYGTPEDLKGLVDAAHARGLMVLLDVVYNHFGPDGNYLHAYAPQFFDSRHRTPWGAAINFDGACSRTVRDFFIHNALYWIDEYRFDGLRLDAVHAINDDSDPDFVSELAEAVWRQAGEERHVHLVLENDRNEARRLVRDTRGRPRQATAQWNDDLHHALHVLMTGEHDGYYSDYASRPLWQMGRCLAQGFAYQGEPSPFRGAAPRGEPSGQLPAGAFVSFTQSHDQVGNRAFGERLAMLADRRALEAAIACVLLAPAPPMLFMGEEYGATTPFHFFCDFGPDLADAVTRGRRAEFSRFVRFREPAAQAAIPDPNAESTYMASKLDWSEAGTPAGKHWYAFYSRCLALRLAHVVPRLHDILPGGTFETVGSTLLRVRWMLGAGGALHFGANFGAAPMTAVEPLPGAPFYTTDAGIEAGGTWPGYAVAFSIEDRS